jgi:hypothetical protein
MPDLDLAAAAVERHVIGQRDVRGRRAQLGLRLAVALVDGDLRAQGRLLRRIGFRGEALLLVLDLRADACDVVPVQRHADWSCLNSICRVNSWPMMLTFLSKIWLPCA